MCLQEKTIEPVIINEGRMTLPHTGDTPVDVWGLYVTVVLVP